ncbi:DUF418 domain-containing protein [Pseudoalteromonas byunsanensis]|uniref:DUF418 domain-containing protein n=1 Tax=Pseudoalteromonas byunsanensis TaxID=327939 RepID=A0A1S1N4J4_9GAMM|nr:DUF418 domain-containing protein [Pseudoalteromonas byunsanensis]OHU94351.1 hypothetical protein BIW53_14825 [Pseudoalteromonas byunsanensis]
MRIIQLDRLRGIAVLGLLFLNVYYFALFETGYVGLSQPHVGDKIIEYLNLLLLDGRFRSLFCMLFGAALVLQYDKRNDVAALKPRLKCLIIFGILHGFLLWPGDILLSYGLAGILALGYLRKSQATLLFHGFVMVLATSSLLALFMFFGDAETIHRDSATFHSILLRAPTKLTDLIIHNASMFVIMIMMLPVLTVWNALGVMLIGMYCYREQVFSRGLEKPLLFRVAVAVCFMSLASAMLLYFEPAQLSALNDGLVWTNAVLGALLITHFNTWISPTSWLSHRLSAVGKLALTCYLLQSIILVTFFVWIAPQARVTFNRIDYLQIALVGMCLQLIFAPLYLKYFKQGPFEWILRRCSHREPKKIEER